MKHALIALLQRMGFLRLAYLSWEYFQARRYGRGVRTQYPRGAPDGLPIPPSLLIVQVAGIPDIPWFLEGGRLATQSLKELLGRSGLRIEEFSSILDFGCGCGRVIRHWHTLPDGIRICGTDYNARLVKWCRRNLGFAEFQTNHLQPPLAYTQNSFGFVYALSVFTHLPEQLQLRWMREMHRVLRPGGYLAMSVHGARYFDTLTADEQKAFNAGQLVVRQEKVAGTNFCGSYHPTPYVQSQLAKGYSVIDFIPEGAKGNPYQDIYLLRKNALQTDNSSS